MRYTLKRHTYAPELMRDKLDEIWDQLKEFDRKAIIDEIIEYSYFGSTEMERSDYGKWQMWAIDRSLKDGVDMKLSKTPRVIARASEGVDD
jgi:hypothetical protein